MRLSALVTALALTCALATPAQRAVAQTDPAAPLGSPVTETTTAPAAPVMVAIDQAPPQQAIYAQQPPAPQYVQPVYVDPATEPPPPRGPRPNLAPIIAGAVLLGVGWICNLVGSLFAGDHVDLFGSGGGFDPAWESFRLTGIVPVLGPWIQLGIQPTSFGTDLWGLWLVIDGLLQAAGLAVLIVGIVTPIDGEPPADVQVALVPTVAPGQAGLSLVGTF